MGCDCRCDCSTCAGVYALMFHHFNIHSFPKPVQPGASTPLLDMPTSTTSDSACSKCGTTVESGERSCCAHGGAWFKKCGDIGDTKYNYTWAEGIQACKRRFRRGLRWIICYCCILSWESTLLLTYTHVTRATNVQR